MEPQLNARYSNILVDACNKSTPVPFVLSRIFNLTRPALMQLKWFSRLYAFVMYYRNRIHAYLDQWAAYQHIKQSIKALAASIKSLFKRQT